jgi:hypothetical protein
MTASMPVQGPVAWQSLAHFANPAGDTCCNVVPLFLLDLQASFARSRGYHGVKLTNKEGRTDRQTGMRGWELGEGEAVDFKWGLACTIPHNATAIVGK